MDPRKREIEQLDAEITRLEQQIGSECAAIGKHVSGLGLGDVRTPELAKYLHSVHTLKKSEEDFRDDISRIRDTIRKLGELEGAIDDAERRARDLGREREGKFVEIGAGAYTVYKGLPDAERDRFRAFFEEVLKLDLEIARFEADLKQLEEDEKRQGIWQRLTTKGKKIVLRGSINRVERQKMKAYADAGGKVADSEFAERTTGDLRLLFDFAHEKKRAIDALHDDARHVREEMQRHRDTLKKYGIDGEPDGRCDELEKRIADVRRELDVLYGWMGQLFMDKDLRSEMADSQLGAKYEIVNAMRHQIARKRAHIHRLKAELEIEELQKKEKGLRQRRKALEDELRVKERQIAVADLEISTGQRRIEELKRVITGEAPYTEAPALPPPPDFNAPRQ